MQADNAVNIFLDDKSVMTLRAIRVSGMGLLSENSIDDMLTMLTLVV